MALTQQEAASFGRWCMKAIGFSAVVFMTVLADWAACLLLKPGEAAFVILLSLPYAIGFLAPIGVAVDGQAEEEEA